MRFLTRRATRFDAAQDRCGGQEPVAADDRGSRPWQQVARHLTDLELKPGQTTWLTTRAVSLKGF